MAGDTALGADFGRYTVSCTTYCFLRRLFPILGLLNLVFLIGAHARAAYGGAWSVAESGVARGKAALVHDAYRQDHAPRAEEVAEKKRDAPPQGFWSLKVAQN